MKNFKRTVLILALTLPMIGCKGLDRLINGSDQDPRQPEPEVISSMAPLPDTAPNFNVPQPANTTKAVFFDYLPADGVVHVTAAPGATVDVFIMDRAVNRWFKLGSQYSGAFWYTFDAAAGTVTYHGDSLNIRGYCVYEYIPVQ